MVLGNLIVSGLGNGSLYCLVAVGLVLIYRVQSIANFAHGEIFMAGAFIGFSLFSLGGLPYELAILLAIAGGAAIGFVMQMLVIRPISTESHVSIVMATVGVSVVLKGVARFLFGGDIQTFPPIFSIPPFRIGYLIITPQILIVVSVAIILTIALFLVMRFTRIGLEMRATQQNVTGARIVGINVKLVHSMTWGVAGGIAAAAGVLAAPTTLLYPDIGTPFLIKGFAAAVLGGFGSPLGAVVGGFAIGIGEMLVGGYLDTSFTEIAPFLIIIAVILLKPDGLFGESLKTRV